MGKFCRYCGTALSAGARFCKKCGGAVSTPPAPAPVYAASASVNQLNQAPLQKGKSILHILLSVLLVIQVAAVALLGWPGFLVKERLEKTAVVDGLAELSGMRVDFSGGTYDSSVLESQKTASVDLAEGAVSAGYDFAFTSIPQGPVVLSAPMPDGLTLAEGEGLYLDICFTMLDEAGEEVMVYDHVEASEQGGQIIAEITPSGYDEMASNVYLDGPSYVRPAYTDKMRFNAQFKVKVINQSQSERFNLVFDRSRLMATSVTDDMIADLLSRMEQVYGQMKEFGFNVEKRTKWPMNIYVTTLKSDSQKGIITLGQYVSSWFGINHGHMNLSRLLFTDFNLDIATAVFAHELMHFVQECYVSSQYYRLDWLDEATAVFFERYFGGIEDKTDHNARQYELYEGIYPASDSARDGYVRGALIAYWAHRGGWMEGKDSLSGTDKMSGLIDLYSTGGYLKESRWLEWINQCVGNPSEYALDFFTRMALNDNSVWAGNGYAPYILHGVITANSDEDIQKFTAELKLSADEAAGEDGQGYSVKVPAYGARIVALSIMASEQNKLEQDGALSIIADGGETLVLLKCLSSNVETQQGAAVSAPEFRKTLEDKYRYLLLVVNPTGGEKTISFKVWMEAENEVVTEAPDGLSIDDVVGTYSGESWDPVEGGAVNSHTFTVSRSGDGLMMSILEGYQWQYEPAGGTATTEVYVPEYDITFNFVFHFISEGGIIRIDGYTSAEGITYTVHEYYKK